MQCWIDAHKRVSRIACVAVLDRHLCVHGLMNVVVRRWAMEECAVNAVLDR